MPALRATLLLALLLVARPAPAAADYHIDPAGDDAGDGSLRSPWRTLARVNRCKLQPGDRVLLRGGATFAGPLLLDADDAGTPEKPVVVGSHGVGRATVEAGSGYAVRVENAGGVEVRDLVCVGRDRVTNRGAGVAFVNTLAGAARLKHVRVRNVEARHFGRRVPEPGTSPEGLQLPEGAGILVAGGPADRSKSGYDDVLIADCVCADNAYYGVLVTGAWDAAAKGYANANVRIERCVAHDNPGDPRYRENHSGSGIFLEDCDGGLIDRCVAYENGALCKDAPGGPCGIWTAVANRVTIQYCESFGNRTQAADGDGFDLDGGCTNCVLQCNYAHDNDGAGILVYTYKGAPHRDRDNVVRWNICENNSVRLHAYGGISVGNDGAGMAGVQVYENTVIVSRREGPAAAAIETRGGGIGVVFRGNLVVNTAGTALVSVRDDARSIEFVGNRYWLTGDVFARVGGRTLADVKAWRAAGREAGEVEFADPRLDLTHDRGGRGTRVPHWPRHLLPVDVPVGGPARRP